MVGGGGSQDSERVARPPRKRICEVLEQFILRDVQGALQRRPSENGT